MSRSVLVLEASQLLTEASNLTLVRPMCRATVYFLPAYSVKSTPPIWMVLEMAFSTVLPWVTPSESRVETEKHMFPVSTSR